jgi:hypothetical protein
LSTRIGCTAAMQVSRSVANHCRPTGQWKGGGPLLGRFRGPRWGGNSSLVLLLAGRRAPTFLFLASVVLVARGLNPDGSEMPISDRNENSQLQLSKTSFFRTIALPGAPPPRNLKFLAPVTVSQVHAFFLAHISLPVKVELTGLALSLLLTPFCCCKVQYISV